ncbi:MAG TPA: LacI family DNA-binding transcriptional regulator [Polyangia bacterium]
MASTITDVARLAECSIKTVSRVINNEAHVTPETRARVQAAIRTLGYAPNIAARRLVQQKASTLCILMYPGFFQPASAVLSRILDLGYEEAYDIFIQPFYPTFPESRNRLVNAIYERRFDGFVTTPPCDADGFVADLLTTYKMPLVQVDPLDRSGSLPYVAGDDFTGAAAAAEHLLALGHRGIAFLMGPRNLRSSTDRLNGYNSALQAAGIPFNPEIVLPSEFNFDGGYTAARLLLQRPPEARPSAIFAGSDEAAYGALFAAQELGLRIPADLSVCGYGDLPYSAHIWPGLTTVHQPAEDMLERAVRLLIDMLKGVPSETRLTLSSRLVARASSGPAETKK